MRARLPVIWRILQTNLPVGRWFSLQDIYALVRSRVRLDAGDRRPPASYAAHDTRWQRNVRSVLLYRTRKAQMDWDGHARYRLPTREETEQAETLEQVVRPQRRRTGRGLDAAARRAVEQRAMTVATVYYQRLGWTVHDVSARESYDLLLRKGRSVLHVEIKGTTGEGDTVTLTKNEVKHALLFHPETELFVVSGIRLRAGDPIRAIGGRSRRFPRWKAEEARLTPLAYAYDVPSR